MLVTLGPDRRTGQFSQPRVRRAQIATPGASCSLCLTPFQKQQRKGLACPVHHPQVLPG